MKIEPAQKTIEELVHQEVVPDPVVEEVTQAAKGYLKARVGEMVLDPVQIDLVLQRLLSTGFNDDKYHNGAQEIMDHLIRESVLHGYDSFTLHTGQSACNLLKNITHSSSRRVKFTIYGDVRWLAEGAANLDVTLYGNCSHIGYLANTCSFEVYGDVDWAVVKSNHTRLTLHGSARKNIGSNSSNVLAIVHGDLDDDAAVGQDAFAGDFSLNGRYGKKIGDDAEQCTFRLNKQSYQGQIGWWSRHRWDNKVILI